MRREEIELLAPAGSYEGFEAAIGAGADAVYVGGAAFGARPMRRISERKSFCVPLILLISMARKLYLTVNTLLKNRELSEQLYDYLLPYYKEGLDAVIVQDMGVFKMIREMFPGMHLHASTQMTVTGPEGMKFLEEQGASRVVTARELSLEEIRRMHETSPIEIESFIHGALCYSYSGQCLMSSILGGRSGNRGRCAQPCRLPYQTALCCGENGRRSEKRKAQELCPLSLKDISTIEILPQILEAGVTSLKIEGRMKAQIYGGCGEHLSASTWTGIWSREGRIFRGARGQEMLLDLFDRGGFTDGYYARHNGRGMVALKEKPEFREGNQKLFEYLDKTYVVAELKEKVRGHVELAEGEPSRLTLESRGEKVQVLGQAPQAAEHQPMTREKVLKQLNKTGGSPLASRHLQPK